MSRLLTRLAVGTAAVSLAVTPGMAVAEDAPSIPVAFGFGITGLGPDLGKDFIHSGGDVAVAGEPGTKKDGRDRLSIPDKPTRLSLHASDYGAEDKELPEGVQGKTPYSLSATVGETTVPSAEAKGDYWLTRTGAGAPAWGLYLRNASSKVECAAPDKPSATSTADAIYYRKKDGKQYQEKLPAPGKELALDEVDLGAPPDTGKKWQTRVHIVRAEDAKTAAADTSAATVGDASGAAAQELGALAAESDTKETNTPEPPPAATKAEEGVVKATTAWSVAVVDVEVDAAGKPTGQQRVNVAQFGYVSCSIPKDFVPKKPADPAPDPGGAAPVAPAAKPNVPVKIPAGDDPGAGNTAPIGLIAFGGVAVAGAAGAAVALRRRKVRADSE
ncbi:hypothetical protein [Amycolatopsis anabasis]|uniref:hypothetical protein n=1 Tax=Amycolatopsis anabasis TaxID=1840409 RepID=UPI00131C6AEE|nr:hypothetical protein [Amycolatopsis anabasis]